MQILTSWAALIGMLILSLGSTPSQSIAVTPAVTVSAITTIAINGVATCRDATTVTVSGSSTYATNRVQASVSYQNSDGDYVLLQQTTSSSFGSGNFWLPIVIDYHTHVVSAGTSLQIIVQLQSMTGAGFTNTAGPITTYANAADRLCANQCSVALTSSDRAPTNGVVTLRSHFGSWFRPEGWLQGATYVNAGQTVQATFADVPCNAWVRAWFYPATGADRTPRMLPSQLWPGEFGTPAAGSSAPYVASFARGLPATKPLESDDPYAPK